MVLLNQMEKGSHIYTRISSTIGTLALIVPTLWSFYHLFCDPLFHWWWSGPDPSVCRYQDVPCQGWFSIHTIARGVRQVCSSLHWLWGKVPPVLAPLSPVVLGVASAGCCSQPVAPPNWHPEKKRDEGSAWRESLQLNCCTYCIVMMGFNICALFGLLRNLIE